jgi:hypothetical protein
MPKPVFIICSESGSEDRVTGLVSLFKVIERIELHDRPAPEEGRPIVPHPLPFQFVAVWALSEGDDTDHEYEFEHKLTLPEGRETTLQSGTFFFEKERPRHRFTVIVNGFVPKGAGLFRVESRIRKVGEGNWLVQAYEMPVIQSSGESDDRTDEPGEDGRPPAEPA